MRLVAAIAAGLLVGCAPFAQRLTYGPAAPAEPVVLRANPAFVPVANPDQLWDQLVDVVDDYFQIDREERVRRVGDVLTEGRIDTFPVGGATLLEPWREDSVGTYNRLESTLQTIRRRALVRVIPTQGGYLVDVAAFKELEDLQRPEHSPSGITGFIPPNAAEPPIDPPLEDISPPIGWIPQGRDVALEQEILCKLFTRLGLN